MFNECHLQQIEKEKQILDAGVENKGDSSKEKTESVLLLLQQDDAVTLVIMKTLGTILKAFHPKWPVKEKKNDSSLPDLPQRLVDLVR